jgi:chromosomal replication initiation ATPase DnaA
MYLSRIMTPSSLKAIQETFKEKDLSSTLHAIDDIETGIERDKDLFETVENLREKISNRLDKMKIPK